MTLSSIIFDSGKILGEFIFEILYFPVWWYSRGLLRVLLWAKNFLARKIKSTGILIWLKNIFTPMYGQSDWAGILISFITRVLQIIFRAIAMFFWITWSLIIITLWLLFPIIVVFEIIFQLGIINSL
jgi:hypothetical protein